jgi:hypothetical protein
MFDLRLLFGVVVWCRAIIRLLNLYDIVVIIVVGE